MFHIVHNVRSTRTGIPYKNLITSEAENAALFVKVGNYLSRYQELNTEKQMYPTLDIMRGDQDRL